MTDETTAAKDPNGITASPLIAADEVEILNEYWTEEAMLSAEPLLPVLDEDDEIELSDISEEIGALVSQNPVMSVGESSSKWDPQPKCPASGPNTERVPNRKIIPYSPVGKLFMTFDGRNYVGSAFVIGKSAVITAGHCVYSKSNGGFADKVLFVPQYHKGKAPLGRWAATQMVTLNGWIAGGKDRFKYDIGGFKVDRPVQPKTGSSGWLANAKPNQGCITGIGYPAAGKFDGQEMWRSTGKNLGGANPIKAYNDMTGGCSGGPWEIWRKGVPLANGLNSFRYRDDPQTMYSPYFGKGFLAVKDWF